MHVLLGFLMQKIVFKANEVIEVSAEYCVELLTNRKPKGDFETDLKLKQMIHEVRMNEGDIEDENDVFSKL